MIYMSDEKETISFRISTAHKRALDTLAAGTSKKRSELISDALRAYLEVQRWQIQEIEAGISEANSGDFASTDEVEKLFAKLSK